MCLAMAEFLAFASSCISHTAVQQRWTHSMLDPLDELVCLGKIGKKSSEYTA